MNQMKATEIIKTLVPEMVRTGDPDTVLRKYAKEHDLPPEQLAKLGYCVNTARTVQHIYNSTDKSASVPLLDVEAMVHKYTDLKLKPAATKRAADNSPFPNVNRDIRIAAGLQQPAVKEASGPRVSPALEKAVRQEAVKVAGDAEDMLHRVASELETKVAGFLRVLENHPGTELANRRLTVGAYPVIEEDAITMGGDMARTASEFVRNKAAQRGAWVLPAADGTKLEMRKVAYDRTGLAAKLVDISEHLQALSILKEATAGTGKDTDAGKGKGTGTSKPKIPKSESTPVDTEPESKPKFPGEETTPVDKETPTPPTPRGRPRILGTGTTPVDEEVDEAPSVARYLAPPLEKRVAPKPTSDEHVDVVRSIRELLKPVSSEADDFLRKRPIESLLTMGHPSSASKQMTIDSTAADMESLNTFNTVVQNDNVLRSVPHEDLLDVYGSILHASPEVARDRQLLSAALRQAVQYQGMDPDSYKRMLDIQEARGDVDKSIAEENRRVYPSPAQRKPEGRKDDAKHTA